MGKQEQKEMKLCTCQSSMEGIQKMQPVQWPLFLRSLSFPLPLFQQRTEELKMETLHAT